MNKPSVGMMNLLALSAATASSVPAHIYRGLRHHSAGMMRFTPLGKAAQGAWRGPMTQGPETRQMRRAEARCRTR